VGVDLGKERGPLDAVLRLEPRDVERRHAQIAVVLERDLHEPLQPLVVEEVPPADIGGRRLGAGDVLVRRSARIGRGDRRRGPLISRLQRAGGQENYKKKRSASVHDLTNSHACAPASAGAGARRDLKTFSVMNT
jgi:hypothetical protein